MLSPRPRSERPPPSTSSTRGSDTIISLTLESEYPSEDIAEAVLRAIGPDNDGYVEAERQGTKLVFRMSSESAGTLRNTADDLMACLKVAEEVAGIGKGCR